MMTGDASDVASAADELSGRTTARIGGTEQPSASASVPAGPAPPVEADDKPTRIGAQPPRIGRYILLRALGEGGMGVVYTAYDEELDRKVAVKILHPSRRDDVELRSRVLREAQALARVSSPSVVHVYQVGETGGQIYIAMELINGTTLSKWQAEPGRSWQEILRMYTAAGQGLLDAHQAGLVHRDFKPDNVLLGKDGWPRVADFGLARVQAAPSGALTEPAATLIKQAAAAKPPLSNLTETGAALGTPLYMSPEQHLGQPIDSRSDQFSFCVALYEALYGRMPFAGNTLQSLYFNVVSGRIQPRPADSHVPTAVHEAIVRGLSTKPEQRFPSMSELLTALSIDIAKDTVIGPGARREVVVSMVAVILITGLGIKVPEWSGLGPERASLTTAAVLFAIFAVMVMRFRRVIGKNWFHRGLLVYGFVVAAWMLAVRGVGALVGLSLSQIMTLDLLAIATMTTMTTVTILSKLWPLIPISCIGVVIASLEPRYASIVMPIVLQLGYVMSAYLWYRAAITPIQKRPPRPTS